MALRLTNFSFVMKLIDSNCSENTTGLIKGEVKRLIWEFWKSLTLDDNGGHLVDLKRPCSGINALKHGQGRTESLLRAQSLPHPIQYFLFAALKVLNAAVCL